MFKVHENGDGSTSIFCSNTGKLICTIRKQQKNMGLGCRPVNVVEQSPKPRSCCFNLDLKSDCLPNEDDKIQNSREEKCDSPSWNEPKEDFSNDCITPEQFARCLNLVTTEKYNNESIEELKSTFPLRHLSRTKASDDSRDLKPPDDIPLTSCLGLKFLNRNKQKNFYCDQSVCEMRIKNYDSFCRVPINSAYVSSIPNLRCREKKDYPVCMPSKISRYTPAHTYAFNKRQRLENLITFKTGLDTHSRKLLLRCNKRLAVSIKRLPDEEIKYWMQKRARFGPITADLIRGEDHSLMGSDSDATVIEHSAPSYINIDLVSDESQEEDDDGDDPSFQCHIRKKTNFQGILNHCEDKVSPLRNRNGQYLKQFNNFEMYKDCCIALRDVLFQNLQKWNGDYYVAGTNIQIPFLQSHINSLDPKIRNNLINPEAKLIANQRYDHAYHRPFSQDSPRKKLLSNSHCLNHKSSKPKTDFKDKLKVSNSVKSKSSSSVKFNSVRSSNCLAPAVNKVVSIAETETEVIDLTDSAPNSPTKVNSYWIFNCYGCGYNKSTTESEADSYVTAIKHMKTFHLVSDPGPFLKFSKTSSGVTIEAFPGYKGSSNQCT